MKIALLFDIAEVRQLVNELKVNKYTDSLTDLPDESVDQIIHDTFAKELTEELNIAFQTCEGGETVLDLLEIIVDKLRRLNIEADNIVDILVMDDLESIYVVINV